MAMAFSSAATRHYSTLNLYEIDYLPNHLMIASNRFYCQNHYAHSLIKTNCVDREEIYHRSSHRHRHHRNWAYWYWSFFFFGGCGFSHNCSGERFNPSGERQKIVHTHSKRVRQIQMPENCLFFHTPVRSLTILALRLQPSFGLSFTHACPSAGFDYRCWCCSS